MVCFTSSELKNKKVIGNQDLLLLERKRERERESRERERERERREREREMFPVFEYSRKPQ